MIRTFLFFSFLFIFSAFIISGKDNHSDKVIGTYWSPDKDGKISIYKKNGKYYGKSVASNTPGLKDVKNPDPKLRDRIVLGQDVFFAFVYDEGDDEYINGNIYNPLDGNTYSAKMWLKDNNLKLRGYLGLPIFGITKTMEPVKCLPKLYTKKLIK